MSSALDHALSDRPDYGFANLSHFLFDEMNFTSTQAADLLLSAARQIRRPAYCEGKRGGLFRGHYCCVATRASTAPACLSVALASAGGRHGL